MATTNRKGASVKLQLEEESTDQTVFRTTVSTKRSLPMVESNWASCNLGRVALWGMADQTRRPVALLVRARAPSGVKWRAYRGVEREKGETRREDCERVPENIAGPALTQHVEFVLKS